MPSCKVVRAALVVLRSAQTASQLQFVVITGVTCPVTTGTVVPVVTVTGTVTVLVPDDETKP
jgi:hypothetical protein